MFDFVVGDFFLFDYDRLQWLKFIFCIVQSSFISFNKDSIFFKLHLAEKLVL